MNPPSSPDAERLLGIVRSLAAALRQGAVDFERLGLDHALERDFGLDSLARVELLARIEREMGVRLNESAFADAETLRDLLKQMAGAQAADKPAGDETPVAPEADEPKATEPAGKLPPASAATLMEVLDWHVAQHGRRVHITLYGEDEHPEQITFSALQAEARELAQGLRAQGLGADDRVAVMLPSGRAFFIAFYGALYAGCVPVPLYPPARPSQIEDHLRRIAGIVTNAGAALLITDERAKLLGHLLRAQCATLHGVATVADLSVATPETAPFPKRCAQDIAFLQYTSGSTGNPKGVVLTHANLRANLDAMACASNVTSADVFVSWLPLYHDMGLIGACMGSLYIGFRLVLLSPLAFLARPARWLWAIHRHRATVSAAPNFAYELCANKLDEHDIDDLDLSCWRLAYNGAEPVSVDTIARFAARFARAGFEGRAMTPVYGLAECSVGLAFPPLGRGPLIDRVERAALSDTGMARIARDDDRNALRVVSCGLPLAGHELRIIDADGRALPERRQGRVQFRGPSATGGYYRNPEASARLFDGEWLNSGDLGYLAGGEIYLTGREKDIIIRAGHNIYPQELEEAVGQVRGVRKGCVAVFPACDAHSATERLVVLAETREKDGAERNRMLDEINRLAVDLAGIPADDIVLAPPRTVLKTSSGKIRRAACRERYERGELRNAQRAPWRQILRVAGGGAVARVRGGLGRAAAMAWSAWAWLIFLAVAPCAWLLIVLAPGVALRRHIARLSARLALALTGLTPRVTGLQHLPDDAPTIVVSNHASYLDALVLSAALPAKFAFVAKQELQRNPLTAIPLRRLGCAFVERFDSARGVEDTRKLEERARAGESLCFFPEGTFVSRPGLLPFRLGAFAVAARTGAPVTPLTLNGTRALLRGDTSRPHYSKLQVLIGKPLPPAADDWQAVLNLRDQAHSRILAQLDEPESILGSNPG